MGRRKKYQPPDTDLPPGLSSALLAEMAGRQGLSVSDDPSDGGWLGDPARERWDRATLEERVREMEQDEVHADEFRRATELVSSKFKLVATTACRSGPKHTDSDEIIDAICWAYYCEWWRSGKTSWRAAIAASFPTFDEMTEDDQDACYRRLMNRVTAEADRRLVRITWSHDWQPLRDGKISSGCATPRSSKNEESRRK